MAEVYTLGESMARFTSTRVGPLRHSAELHVGVAGAESNVAIGLARLGASARWLGRVGDDEFGHLIANTIRGEGVEVAALRDAEASTGLLVKERRTASSSRVLYYRARSAGSRLSPADVEADAEALRRARVLHVTGITLALSETARAAVGRAVDLAREAGVTVSFDVNFRASLWTAGQAGEALREIAARADLVFAGVEEARLIAEGADDAALARELCRLGARHAVIKRGAEGALAMVEGELLEAPVLTVPELDPVGAGDAFTAGYLAEHLTGAGPERSLDTAARCGAFAVTVDGDWEGLPAREDLALLDAAGDVRR